MVPCPKSARPLKDWETRENMMAKELDCVLRNALLREHFVHGEPTPGPFPQARWSVTEAVRKRCSEGDPQKPRISRDADDDAGDDAATEKLHDRSQSKVESEADGGWDECFDRLYVW